MPAVDSCQCENRLFVKNSARRTLEEVPREEDTNCPRIRRIHDTQYIVRNNANKHLHVDQDAMKRCKNCGYAPKERQGTPRRE